MLKRLLFSPFLIQIVVTRRCNLTCAYCTEFDQTSEAVPTRLLEKRIDKARELGAFSVELTGGEPLLHPDIVHLVGYAKRRRFVKVMMISNAYLLSEEKIEALNQAGLDDLQVSVDGVEPNAATVKVLRPLRPKLEALARRARFRVTLSGVIGCSTSDEVMAVIGFAKTHKFRSRVLLVHGPDGQLRLGPEEQALYHRVKAQLGGRFSEAGDYRSRLLRGEAAPFKCRAGSRYLYVDEFGIARWCSQMMSSFGIPLEAYTHADLRRQFKTAKPCSANCTLGCARSTSAYDEWRPQSLAPDPTHERYEPIFRMDRIRPQE